MTANTLKCHSRPALGRVGVAIAVILTTVTISTSSFALGTAKQRAACTADVMRLCFSVVFSGDKAIVDCMKRNFDGLSNRCKKTLPPA